MPKRHWIGCSLALGLLLLLLTRPVQALNYTVTNTNDSGIGSLRKAISDAASNSGADTVIFSIPTNDPGYNPTTGVWTITPLTQLPPVTDATAIDGVTQTEFGGDPNPLGPEVELDGSSLGAGASGVYIQGDLNQVRGLVINRFAGYGVYITQGMTNTVASCYVGTDPTGTVALANGEGVYVVDDATWNTIGGEGPGDGNLISGNSGRGVVIEATHRNNVWGNIIGADRTGTARLPNGLHGVHIWGGAQFNLVGGELPEHGNLISGNNKSGVYIEDVDTDHNRVGGNIIGLTADQSAPLYNGNHGVGVYGGAIYNDVGSGTLEPNVIGGNGWSGVAIVNSDVTAVHGNFIGTNPSGALGLGNAFHGIDIYAGQDNSASSNVIAYNGLMTDGHGIRMREAAARYNIVTQNSIHHNGGQGIRLLNNAQDNIPVPVIISASCTAVSGTACSNCTVEIFTDSEDEGEHMHWPPYAFADGAGNWTWTGSLIGPNLTATAMDAADNTSEFSAPWELGLCQRVVMLPLVMRNHPGQP